MTDRIPKNTQTNILDAITSGVLKLRISPLVTDPGITRGVFLIKVEKISPPAAKKIPIFERFRMFLIAVNVFEIFVFSSATTLLPVV